MFADAVLAIVLLALLAVAILFMEWLSVKLRVQLSVSVLVITLVITLAVIGGLAGVFTLKSAVIAERPPLALPSAPSSGEGGQGAGYGDTP